jgi:hypothetical protein
MAKETAAARGKLDDATRKVLSEYLSDVQRLPNESAKTHRFAQLVETLFPGSGASWELVSGIEKAVRIDLGERTKRGRVDAYYGNAVVEFENSLRATEKTAVKQLEEYAAGIWKDEGEPHRALLCIASDGVTWKTYIPQLKRQRAGGPRPSDIQLQPVQTLELTEKSLSEFWYWITGLLFREQRTTPTAERFQRDFGLSSPAYVDAVTALEGAWKAIGKRSECRLALDTWKRYLTFTYGTLGQERPELEALFLKHTYLASIARLLIWAAISKGKAGSSPYAEIAQEVLSGDYFRREGIENLVEDDFFQWVRREDAAKFLAPVWERTLAQMMTYDLARLDQDVLKGVYQDLVDPKDRHDLGEYYTPEWLCEAVVEELLPDTGFVAVLDPTCGSGSFLRAAIDHMLEANPKGGDATRLRSVLSNVMGIDIHPLAVTIARATYVLALRDLVKGTSRPIQIPVYLADALFLPREVRQLTFEDEPGYEIRFGKNRSVSIPEELIQSPEMFDPAIAASAEIAIDHAGSGKETEGSLRKYLEQAVPQIPAHREGDAMVRALWRFTRELADLIAKQENSIWAFIVKNAYRPAMLRNQFDFIVGNPPWLSYRYIADPEYQAEVKKRAVTDYGIAPESKKLTTQMELATVFLVHALATFGKVGARLGFVMPRSVLSADQHENLRLRNYRAPVEITDYWDLLDVAPIFNVPSCVLFAERTREPPRAKISYTMPAREWSGNLTSRDETWAVAEREVAIAGETARVIYLGHRSALSTKKGKTMPTEPSQYAGRFRQGATIVPRNCYFVEVEGLNGRPDPERVYSARTEPEQAQLAKAPYKGVTLSGQIEGRFLFSTVLSKHILPFVVLNPAVVALPVRVKSGRPVMWESDRLRKEGYRNFAKWMSEVERIWADKRGSKADRQTAYERLDYNRELSEQDLDAPYLVLYNAAGTNLCAAAFDRTASELTLVVDAKVYWAACNAAEEADYLVAILNSETVNEAIKPFQSVGLLGERDIHKKVLDLPIPVYDTRNTDHRAIAALGTKARTASSAYTGSSPIPPSLGRARGVVREALAVTLAEIDKAVVALLL